MSKLYDVIIIGASKEGISAYNILRKNKSLNICVISPNFSNTTTNCTILKADRLYGKVVYSTFNHGLIKLELDSKDFVCGLNVIIAAGMSAKKLNLKTSSIYYKLADIKTKSKLAPIALVGNNEDIVKAALKLAETHKYIYICNPDITLHCDNNLALAAYRNSNIAVLPLCNIVECYCDTTGKLREITLDTFEKIKCNFILASIGSESTLTQWFNASFLKLTDTGLVRVNENYEVEDFPHLFVIGNCANKQAFESGKIAAEYINKIIK